MDRLKILAEMVLDRQWTLPAIEELLRRFTRAKSRARKYLGATIHARFTTPPSRSALVAFLKSNNRDLCSKLNWSRIETDRQFGIKMTTMRRVVAPTFAATIPAGSRTASVQNPSLPNVSKRKAWPSCRGRRTW